MTTELRDVVGYESFYAVTADGRIWSKPKSWKTGKDGRIAHEHAGQWLRMSVGSTGYKSVMPCIDSQRRRLTIHSIVAKAWIPNPLKLPQVNHRDGDKTNNNVENLEWVSESENNTHAYRTGLRRPIGAKGDQNGRVRIRQNQLAEVRAMYAAGGLSMRKIALHFNVSESAIYRIVRGIRE